MAYLEKTFKLADIGEAHRYIEESRVEGKVVIKHYSSFKHPNSHTAVVMMNISSSQIEPVAFAMGSSDQVSLFLSP